MTRPPKDPQSGPDESADKPTSISVEDLFGPASPEISSEEEMQVVKPKSPTPQGVQRWIRRTLLGGAALLAGFLGVHIVLQTYRTDRAKHTEDEMGEILPPLVPLDPSQITTDCRIRFIPETGAYRGACAVTQGENIKPQLRFRKRDRMAEKGGAHQADLLFSRGGKTCQTKEPIDVIPGQTQEIKGAVFTCVAPLPK